MFLFLLTNANLKDGGILLAFNNLPCWHILYRSSKMNISIFNALFNSNLELLLVKKKFVRKEDAPFL